MEERSAVVVGELVVADSCLEMYRRGHIRACQDMSTALGPVAAERPSRFMRRLTHALALLAGFS
jgi:hypothetical protein